MATKCARAEEGRLSLLELPAADPEEKKPKAKDVKRKGAAGTRRNWASCLAATRSRETEERGPLGWAGLGLTTTAPLEGEVGEAQWGREKDTATVRS